MKNIFLLFLFITFKQIYGNGNVTEPTTTIDTATTEMYTSMATLPDITANMTVTSDCDYEYMETLVTGEGIDITICGYKEDDVSMTEITLNLPTDRWVGVGFISSTNYAAQTFRMDDVYAIIVPSNSRDITEHFMVGKGDIGTALQGTTSIVSDTIDDGERILTLKRKETIGVDDLNGDAAVARKDEYFSFSDFTECDDEIYIIYAFAANPGDAVSVYHGQDPQRGSIKALVMAVNDEDCQDGEGDDGFRNTPLSIISILIISFIAILIN